MAARQSKSSTADDFNRYWLTAIDCQPMPDEGMGTYVNVKQKKTEKL
jgi:hypothetical protein